MTLVRPETHHAPVRRRVELSTTVVSETLTRVSVPGRVLGFVRADWNGFAALRGTRVESAQLLGRYATRGLALEALRQRPRSI